jgi:hypothetical protein
VEKMIEVRYAGVVVGRSSIIRELDAEGLFLGVAEPMPVGTPVVLAVDDRAVQGRVELVSESQEQARSGMRVRFLEPDVARLFGTPGEHRPGATFAEVNGGTSPAHDASTAPSAATSITPSEGPSAMAMATPAQATGPGATPASAAAPGTGALTDAAVASAAAGEVAEPDDSEQATEPVSTESGPVLTTEPSGLGQGSAGGGPRKNRRNRRR